MTLDKLPVGRQARVTRLEGAGPLIQRLMVLGLLEGSRITMLRRAIGGDPLEIDVMGYCLSLRKAEASHVAIDLI